MKTTESMKTKYQVIAKHAITHTPILFAEYKTLDVAHSEAYGLHRIGIDGEILVVSYYYESNNINGLTIMKWKHNEELPTPKGI